ncbi:hypothetical protein L0222_20170 [bacterium]|nr:hypothetical protein [bacterium]
MCDNFALFALLAVLTNTALPFPFEPVLLFHIDKYPAIVLVLTGSICAAAGGNIDQLLANRIRKRLMNKFTEARFYFYVATFLFALLPLPFSVIRVSLLKIKPKSAYYGSAIFAGRFIRYSLITRILETNYNVGILIVLLLISSGWLLGRVLRRHIEIRTSPSNV